MRIILVLFIITKLLFSQAIIKFEATTEKVDLLIGDTAVVYITLKTKGKDIPPLISTPQVSRYAIVDSSQSSSFHYTIPMEEDSPDTSVKTLIRYFLHFKDTGTFTFPEIAYSYKSDTASTKPITFTVSDKPYIAAEVDTAVVMRFIPERCTLSVNESSIISLEILWRSSQNNRFDLNEILDVAKSISNKSDSIVHLDNATGRPKNSRPIMNGIRYNRVCLRFFCIGQRIGTTTIKPTPFTYIYLDDKYKNLISTTFAPDECKIVDSTPPLTIVVK